MADPSRLTAAAAAKAIAAGEVSSEELTEACLARIRARDAGVLAWTHLDPEFALRQARAADANFKSGAAPGPLHGVPVGIKDIIDVAGLRCEHGSQIFAGRVPETDAACVSALRAAGAVILGKTVTTELANRTARQTRNPHDPARTPGGSSSGSAAAVADFQIPLALGTQTAGSVIRPASFCGVHAIKPTLGLIPRTGALLQSHTLDTIGIYGRSVEDLALGLDALAVEDARDSVSFARGRMNYVASLANDNSAKIRLAFVRSPVWDRGEKAMQSAVETFAASLGAACTEVDLSGQIGRALEWHGIVMGAEGAHYYGPLLDAHPGKLGIADRIAAGRKIAAADYIRAVEMRDSLYADVARLLADHDAILTPSAPGIAPKDLNFTGDPVFNSIWTYLGVPCVNLPLMSVEGMPLGIQLVGRRREEAKLLGVAKALEGLATSRA